MTSANTEYLLDTYAWVEYFVGSEEGQIGRELVESEKISTSIICIAELSNKYYRESLLEEWKDRYKFIISKSNIIHLTMEIVKEAGPRKWKLRENSDDVGLADAIIIETAIQGGFTVVSGDPYFKDIENCLFLKRDVNSPSDSN